MNSYGHSSTFHLVNTCTDFSCGQTQEWDFRVTGVVFVKSGAVQSLTQEDFLERMWTQQWQPRYSAPAPTLSPQSQSQGPKRGWQLEKLYGLHYKSCSQRDPAKESPMSLMEEATCAGTWPGWQKLSTLAQGQSCLNTGLVKGLCWRGYYLGSSSGHLVVIWTFHSVTV